MLHIHPKTKKQKFFPKRVSPKHLPGKEKMGKRKSIRQTMATIERVTLHLPLQHDRLNFFTFIWLCWYSKCWNASFFHENILLFLTLNKKRKGLVNKEMKMPYKQGNTFFPKTDKVFFFPENEQSCLFCQDRNFSSHSFFWAKQYSRKSKTTKVTSLEIKSSLTRIPGFPAAEILPFLERMNCESSSVIGAWAEPATLNFLYCT